MLNSAEAVAAEFLSCCSRDSQHILVCCCSLFHNIQTLAPAIPCVFCTPLYRLLQWLHPTYSFKGWKPPSKLWLRVSQRETTTQPGFTLALAQFNDLSWSTSRNPFEPNCLFLEPFAEKLGISSLVLILGHIPGILCSLRDQWPPFHRSPPPHISLHHIPAAHTVPIYLHWLKDKVRVHRVKVQ
jgi:hypothetical protein